MAPVNVVYVHNTYVNRAGIVNSRGARVAYKRNARGEHVVALIFEAFERR